jgi:hypothetical protein
MRRQVFVSGQFEKMESESLVGSDEVKRFSRFDALVYGGCWLFAVGVAGLLRSF